MSTKKVLLLYPKTNRHLGLWNDLETDGRCYLRCAAPKEIDNSFLTLLRSYSFRIYNRFRWLSFHSFWFEYHDLFKIVKHVDHLLLIDGALNTVTLPELMKCRKLNPSLKISLYFINSMEAQSPIMRKVRPKINQFKWDDIFTFDPVDAKKYHYKYLGFNYFSSRKNDSSHASNSDVFFVGGLKGGRTELIYNLYERLKAKGVKCDFFLFPIDDKNIEHLPDATYFTEWCPYERVLQHVQQTNCIIEIIQEGQNGATLRYFEAVSMNKKLLTNNPNIVVFPFYNPKWMKIFKTLDDIDLDWIKDNEPVDYKYNGEFSPTHLIDSILSTK